MASNPPGGVLMADCRSAFASGASAAACCKCSRTRAIHSIAWTKPPLVSVSGQDSAKSHAIGRANRAKVLRIFSGSLVQVASALPRSARRLIVRARQAAMASRHSSG